ncbi:MAG: hypothetical protein ACXWT4_06100 [Methylobacter sp.]
MIDLDELEVNLNKGAFRLSNRTAIELICRLREAERDAVRLDWFQENIVFHKPAGYDGCDYGRFDIWWKSETNDLRDAIDAAIEKEGKHGQG